jgi:hypothetical protein
MRKRVYLTFVMDIKRTAGSFAALGAALFFCSGTPLAKTLLADVSRWLMAGALLPKRTRSPIALAFAEEM